MQLEFSCSSYHKCDVPKKPVIESFFSLLQDKPLLIVAFTLNLVALAAHPFPYKRVACEFELSKIKRLILHVFLIDELLCYLSKHYSFLLKLDENGFFRTLL